MAEPGTVSETYVAAIQHDLVKLDGATPVGVVRKPTGWFHGVIAENVQELGPPELLLEEVETRRDDLAMAGMCDTGAHNAAWEETDFEGRYREYLDSDDTARAALNDLRERVRDGEDIALVCFEGDDKRCHRHIIEETIREEL
ncbi:MAG: hypothetical protein ACI8UR_000089 [Natronomonas sp.]|jgi:hypothetical protein|uniref:DUF488 domain-containing protein n=1 Tax=Natronomonas sp. TaxID=2184060 RepID=UPI003989C33C